MSNSIMKEVAFDETKSLPGRIHVRKKEEDNHAWSHSQHTHPDAHNTWDAKRSAHSLGQLTHRDGWGSVLSVSLTYLKCVRRQ